MFNDFHDILFKSILGHCEYVDLKDLNNPILVCVKASSIPLLKHLAVVYSWTTASGRQTTLGKVPTVA